MRYINSGSPTPWKVMEAEILPIFLAYDEDHPGFGFWAVKEKLMGEFLGWFSVRPANETGDEAVLGYRFKKAAWGQGYATEGLRALIQMGFREMGVERVVATTYEDGTASRRVGEIRLEAN